MAHTPTEAQLKLFFDNARLSVAAYSNDLRPEMSRTDSNDTDEFIKRLSGNPQVPGDTGIGFTQSQAEAFTARYEIVAPTFTADSGAQVNIFRDMETGETHFAITGTQLPEDFVRDLLVADIGQIGLGQPPAYQLVDVINYYNQISTPEGEQALQVDYLPVQTGVNPFSGAPVYEWQVVAVPSVAGEGLIPPGTAGIGHSLGGALGNGLGRVSDFDLQATINAPGQAAGLQEDFYQQLADVLDVPLKDWPDATHLSGSGLSIISAIYGHDGGTVIEIPTPVTSHRSVVLMNAAERMYQVAQLNPSKSFDEIAEIVRASYDDEDFTPIEDPNEIFDPENDGVGFWNGNPLTQEGTDLDTWFRADNETWGTRWEYAADGPRKQLVEVKTNGDHIYENAKGNVIDIRDENGQPEYKALYNNDGSVWLERYPQQGRALLHDKDGGLTAFRYDEQQGKILDKHYTAEQVQNEDINDPFDPQNDGIGVWDGTVEGMDTSDLDTQFNNDLIDGLIWDDSELAADVDLRMQFMDEHGDRFALVNSPDQQANLLAAQELAYQNWKVEQLNPLPTTAEQFAAAVDSFVQMQQTTDLAEQLGQVIESGDDHADYWRQAA